MSINGTKKRGRGRPATGLGVSINCRLQPDQLAELDRWIAEQDRKMSRPEALRTILGGFLSREALMRQM